MKSVAQGHSDEFHPIMGERTLIFLCTRQYGLFLCFLPPEITKERQTVAKMMHYPKPNGLHKLSPFPPSLNVQLCYLRHCTASPILHEKGAGKHHSSERAHEPSRNVCVIIRRHRLLIQISTRKLCFLPQSS